MTLRAGFIGAGRRSQSAHYPNVQRLADVEMTAVCELDEERLDQVVEKYGFSNVYANHREMLDNVELDIVYCVMHERWLLQPVLDCLNARQAHFY
ncbi:MAG: Gfo/Idh/MocA family oxidoreductase [Caldilineaceae bacterium]